MPARSIHSASVLEVGGSGRGRRPWDCDMLAAFLWPGIWWRGCGRFWLWRFGSLDGAARVVLLLRAWWRAWELLRECESIGGVLGTETLDRYEDGSLSWWLK